jgi:prepilin-type N-terminal cleavage/methylation domain-containing protein
MILPMNKKEQGFTLIELLVVIAIIGILAAMVITNLRTARAKARDASAITSMSSARAEAENFYDDNGLSYTGLCPTATYPYMATAPTGGTNFETLMYAAAKANTQTVTCLEGGQVYRAFIQMAATADYFCIDSRGFAGKLTAVPSSASGECQ